MSNTEACCAFPPLPFRVGSVLRGTGWNSFALCKPMNSASLSRRCSIHLAEGERVAPDVWLGTARSRWPRVNLACNKTARLQKESELLPAYVRGRWIEIDFTSVNASLRSIADH